MIFLNYLFAGYSWKYVYVNTCLSARILTLKEKPKTPIVTRSPSWNMFAFTQKAL